MREIRRVAVLGAGTMGSRIAGHFANTGIPALLLDVVAPDGPDRSMAARKGVSNAMKGRPGAFVTASAAELVTPGNFEDDLAGVGACDWIIEAVTENLEIKRALWRRVAEVRTPGSIVSTNTSGIRLAAISEGFPPEFRRNFLGTHFFNPPRYLHLVEVIPGAETDAGVVAFVSDFCDRRLGKGVAPCKDTPNFIANRIGSFFVGSVCRLMEEGGYTIEEADALTGPLIGLPNSASFRLLDIIGLDIWSFMGRNLFEAVPNDRWRERFLPPRYQLTMLDRGWLGEKSGQGFYKRITTGVEREIHAIDWRTLEYHRARKVEFPSTGAARKIADLPERLRFLTAAADRAGAFLWRLLSDVAIYSVERVPEISDRIVEIDRAMRWGYAHSLGPFELWDVLGLADTARRIEREGRAVPPTVEAMLASGATSFYRAADRGGQPRTQYFDLRGGEYQVLEEREGILELRAVRRARGVVASKNGASLVDLGDGVLCVEFHARLNTLDEDTFETIQRGLDGMAGNCRALLIANQGDLFSAGADLGPVLTLARESKWAELDAWVRRLQSLNLALKRAVRPVVAAPFQKTLNEAAEMVLHVTAAQAFAELSMGFQQADAGLIPCGGGLKELVLRLGDAGAAFDLVLSRRLSASAAEARELGLLRPADAVSMNPERLIGDAKALALALAERYSPAAPPDAIPVAGDGGEAILAARCEQHGESLAGHDKTIAEALAYVLSGGRRSRGQTVSEQELLDLERETFLRLCGDPRTQERMNAMVTAGRPIRN